MREVIYSLSNGHSTKNYNEALAFKRSGGNFKTIVQNVPSAPIELSEKRRAMRRKIS